MSNSGLNKLYAAAESLYEARRTGKTIDQISVSFGISSLEDAYAVANINCQRRINEGGRLIGKKVGLTSTAVQKQLGVDQPDFGLLFEDMEYLNGSMIERKSLIQPKAEAEIAFIVGKTLDQEKVSWGEFLESIEYAVPAIEVVDSAITNWKLTLVDTVADNASCGIYVLGDQPTKLGQFSLGEVEMTLYKNGESVSSGRGTDCLGHPLRAAYWLACTMAEIGEPLRAGEVILSGALGPMVEVAEGDELKVDIGGLGSVECTFV